MDLDERKKKVLYAIIRDYIVTAEPVGSRTIAKKYGLGVSPATIRNEMSDLEELGYIEQPYTSAGRIPSHRGYRYFVDCLMEKEILDQASMAKMHQSMNTHIHELDALIGQASKVLSQMTSYTAVLLGPQMGKANIQQIQLVPLQPTKCVLILITSAGVVESKVLDIPESILPEDLEEISRIINRTIRGKTMDDVKAKIYRELREVLKKQKQILVQAVELMEEVMKVETAEKLYLDGTLNIFNLPEFKDVEKIRSLLGILEEENTMRNLLLDTPENGVQITIGNENQLPEIRECSMITATYRVNGEVQGVIGLLGPTRMDYGKAVTVVEGLSSQLQIALKHFFGK